MNSAGYKHKNYVDVENELTEAGFNNIQLNSIDDINSYSEIKDGEVENITIGEVTDFEALQKFSPNDSVVINFHNIPKISPPLNSNDVQDISYKELVELFEKAGFTDVNTEEIYDLDPDNSTEEYINEVLINDSEDFNTSDIVPFDSNITIKVHYPFTKYTAKIVIDFSGNLVFDKYDVSMFIDGEKQEDLPHGESTEREYRLKEGMHHISFQKDDDESIKGLTEIDVTSDVEASYRISCHGDYIDVETQYIDYDIVLEEGQIKIMNGEESYYGDFYEDVNDELINMGFKNIKLIPYYDIVFGITDSGSVKSVTIDGKDDYRRGNIFQEDDEVIISYSMPSEEDPKYIEEQKRKEEEKKKKAEEREQKEKKRKEEAEADLIEMPHSNNFYIGSEWDLESLTNHFKELGFVNIEQNPEKPRDDNYNKYIFEVWADKHIPTKGEAWDEGEKINRNDTIEIYYNEYPLMTIDNSEDLKAFVESDNKDYVEFAHEFDGHYIEIDGYISRKMLYDGVNYIIIANWGNEPSEKEDYSFGTFNLKKASMFIQDHEFDETIEEGELIHFIGRIDKEDSKKGVLEIKTVLLERR